MDEISADELYEGLLAYGLFAEKDSTDVYRYAKRSNELFGGNYQGAFILNLLFDENYRYAIPSNNI